MRASRKSDAVTVPACNASKSLNTRASSSSAGEGAVEAEAAVAGDVPSGAADGGGGAATSPASFPSFAHRAVTVASAMVGPGVVATCAASPVAPGDAVAPVPDPDPAPAPAGRAAADDDDDEDEDEEEPAKRMDAGVEKATRP
jgi:hypothetical protein